MVTSRTRRQRWLHTLVSGMCGRSNSCSYERHGVRKDKIDYKSQPSAERAAGNLQKKFGREFDVYQCWFCHGWHVGNAHNLTVLKFLSILWVFLIQRKRVGPKVRGWEKNMVFVFGSNEAGIHGAGAALDAKIHHGAVYGHGIGRKGNSYAIPTKDTKIQTLQLPHIRRYVAMFLTYARNRQNEQFMVTAVGCGLAGLNIEDMAKMFSEAPDNCWFDTMWKPFLGDSKKYWGTWTREKGYEYSDAYKALVLPESYDTGVRGDVTIVAKSGE